MPALALIRRLLTVLLTGAALAFAVFGSTAAAGRTLLNVSYDPTRELYEAINAAFAAEWQKDKHEKVTLQHSHGGSGAQARKVIDGMAADVVTLALAADIDAIAEKTGKLPANWQSLLPHNSTPFTSTIVFLVRKGNPKHIRDWDDLAKPGVGVITPNPKTSGGARWNYLAAWGYALEKFGHDEGKTRAFVAAIYGNVPVLDAGARGSTMSFVRAGIGDVLIAWENEAMLARKNFGPDQFEIVVPSLSILAEPPVAVVTKNAEARGTSDLARAYLEFLYTPAAQNIAVKQFYRPTATTGVDPAALKQFPALKLITIDDTFGGWAKAQKTFFADGGVFDQIYKPKGR